MSLNTLESEDPIAGLIKANFKEKYSEVGKIGSGECIPWEKDGYERYIANNNAQPRKVIDSGASKDDDSFVEISSSPSSAGGITEATATASSDPLQAKPEENRQIDQRVCRR